MTRGRGKHFWWGVSGALALVIVLVGWFVGIGPQLAAATTARADAEGLRLQNEVLLSRVVMLEQQEPDPLRESLQDAVAALPYGSDLPALTRQFTEQAERNNVALESIVIGSTVTASGPVADPAAPAESLLAIPVTLSSTGRGADQRAFLRAIQEQGPRRALVTSTQLSPRGEGGSVSDRSTMTASLTAFVAPLTSDAETQLEELLSGASAS